MSIGLQDYRAAAWSEDFAASAEAEDRWAKEHTCADCRLFQPCPCGCGWGMCDEDPYREYFVPEDTIDSLECMEAEAR